jgi:hypothetical protein
MNPTDWADFEWWRARYDADEVGLDEPFVDEAWSADTAFVWAKIIEPLRPGVGSPSGFWATFPHVRAAAGALRFVLLPDWFGAWLGRDEWDEDPDAFVAAESMLAGAEQAADEALRVDVPLMREILAELDAVLALTDAAACEEALQAVIEKVNARWHGTGSWEFSLELFRGPLALADELAARRTEYLGDDATDAQAAEALGMTKAEWRALFERATSDAEARAEVQDLLDDDAF